MNRYPFEALAVGFATLSVLRAVVSPVLDRVPVLAEPVATPTGSHSPYHWANTDVHLTAPRFWLYFLVVAAALVLWGALRRDALEAAYGTDTDQKRN